MQTAYKLSPTPRLLKHACLVRQFSSSPDLPQPIPPACPDLLMESVSRLHSSVLKYAVCTNAAKSLYNSLRVMFSHFSSEYMTDECWTVLENSAIISDLAYCVRPIIEFEILQHALRILRCLFTHSILAVQSLIENNAFPAILDRIKCVQNQEILTNCIILVKISVGYGLFAPFLTDTGWFREYLALPRCFSDHSIFITFSEFIESAYRLFPADGAKLWRRAMKMFTHSVTAKTRDWKVLQKSLLESFLATIRIMSDRIPFLAAGVLDIILQFFGRLPQYNQILAAKLIVECVSPVVPPNVFLSRAISKFLDFTELFQALTSDNSELKAVVIEALESLFVHNGDLVEPATDLGLPDILLSLINVENFMIKASVLKLVRAIVVHCTSDHQREPFMSIDFLELLLAMIDDVGSPDLHAHAQETVLALQRTFRTSDHFFDPFLPFLR
jgi:hypothetical protein